MMREAFDLDGICFQDIPKRTYRRHQRSSSQESHQNMLAVSLSSGTERPTCLSVHSLDKILRAYPKGEILHREGTEGSSWVGDSSVDQTAGIDTDLSRAIDRAFQESRQLLFMPLTDVIHKTTAVACIGWVKDDSRIYTSRTDLSALSVLSMTIMSQVLRTESLMLDQVKSDFMGSISHEMRSPLHNTLGNLELLLDSDCDPDQRDLTVNARFGATQLLETIDKILLYSNVSATGDIATPSPHEREGTNSNAGILEIGPQDAHVISAEGTVDLVSLCEEVVEDVSKRMRLLETVMSPASDRYRSRQPSWTKSGDSHNQSQDDDQFTLVMFDASSTRNLRLPERSTFRVILENLLSNAMKHSRAGSCARIALTLEDDSVDLAVIDCGVGMSDDFVRNHLYVPFSQQDPVKSGIGLGLALVKRSTDSLDGDIHIETDRELGTKVVVTVDLEALKGGVEQHDEGAGGRFGGTTAIPALPRRSKEDLPMLKACFYTPSPWAKRYDKRDQRSIDSVFESLSHTLSDWFQPVLAIWHDDEDLDTPDLAFVCQQNLKEFDEQCGERFANVKKVVFCAAIGKNSEQDKAHVREASALADAIIVGAVLPSKLWQMIITYFPHVLPPGTDDYPDQDHQGGYILKDSSLGGIGEVSAQDTDREFKDEYSPGMGSRPASPQNDSPADKNRPSGNGRPDLAPMLSLDLDDGSERRRIPTGSSHDDQCRDPSETTTPANGDSATDGLVSTPRADTVSRPRMLLVDDNNVNLKMLEMFVKKCDIPESVTTAVTGGQEAVDAYQIVFAESGMSSPGFDVIFMDLSMPSVSGFDATKAIRRIEAAAPISRRAYIAALTGLVSEHDRHAAYEAGVDDYFTKPAGLKTIRGIIDAWRTRHEAAL